MNTIASSTDTAGLRRVLNAGYPLYLHTLTLHRDSIGYVYIAKSHEKKYICKLYRPFETENALRSVEILQFLKQQDYPVVSIVPTCEGGSHLRVDTPSGISVVILFDFIQGAEPELDNELETLACQVGRLHTLMDGYPHPLPCRGKDFFVERYLDILRELQYPPQRIDALEAYGGECWARLERLPRGFCHGDLHTGNMRMPLPGRYVLFDFDIASRTFPLIDIATLCDGSDFNRFDPAAYDRTRRRFEVFYRGYRRQREMTGEEIAAIFDFIAIRHYEIIATITRCHGLDELSPAFLDEQYDWLLRWRDLCQR